MAIISWPDSMTRMQIVPCIICHQATPPAEATAGLRYSDGTQAFACTKHAWSSSQHIIGWTDFAIEQQAIRQRKELAVTFASQDGQP